jgi:DUF1009 family protein
VKYALIAGSGRFPFLVLEAARGQGIAMTVAAIREEADAELQSLAASFHWIGLGELSRLIEILKSDGVTHIIMAGQVKHSQIFSSLRPDWRLAKLLFALPRKNTDSLISAVAKVLGDEGITLLDSTVFLKNFMAPAGLLTRRAPNESERADLEYGRAIARQIARLDVGQSVVICERACVAVEAMEGTDAAIARAATFANGRSLTVVKVAKPKQDMRFDVPVIGPATIRAMRAAGATALGIDAGRTLLIDRDQLSLEADEAGIAIDAVEPSDVAGEPA